MPEENKYTKADEATPESSVQKPECADTDVINEEISVVSQINSANDAQTAPNGEDIPDNADNDLTSTEVEDDLDATTPLAHISEDGDQLTLEIPADEPIADSSEADKSESSRDGEKFTSAFLREAPAYDEKKPRKIDGRFDFVELLPCQISKAEFLFHACLLSRIF